MSLAPPSTWEHVDLSESENAWVGIKSEGSGGILVASGGSEVTRHGGGWGGGQAHGFFLGAPCSMAPHGKLTKFGSMALALGPYKCQVGRLSLIVPTTPRGSQGAAWGSWF